MAKIITRAVFQMTSSGLVPLEEEAFEYAGPVAEAKGASGSTIDPATLTNLTKQSADLNRTNTAGTYGSSTWNIDPATGRYKQSVTLDPSQQAQLDARNSIANQMLGSAQQSTAELNGPFSYDASISDTAQAGFDKSLSRLQPQWQQQNRDFDQKLSNQGIPLGSEAYNKSSRDLAQTQNDQLQGAAQTAANTDNSLDLSQRQQNLSDIANMMATQNTQTPTAGTNAAVDTTGNFNTLNSGVSALFNNAAGQRASGTGSLLALLGAFL